MLKKLLRRSAFVVYALALSWVLFFLLLEAFPGILNRINLQDIRYYAVKSAYVSDPELVFVYRHNYVKKKHAFFGDTYARQYGTPEETDNYVVTYDDRGFRKNSSIRPYELVVIGDSFAEIGETDNSTFPEYLAHESGKSVGNLGRAWYGPYQYLEVLKRYALQEEPQYILFCFFSGNDFRDLREYEKWKNGGSYYFHQGIDKRNIASRFLVATKETARFFKRNAKRILLRPPEPPPDLSKFGVIQIGDRKVSMSFDYWEEKVSLEEVNSLRSLLLQFKEQSESHGIVPIVVYIPTASQVYAANYSLESDPRFIEKAKAATANPSLDAVANASKDLTIQFIDLLPVLRNEAANGKLLFYRFDTHWNSEGRRVAASHIASYLKNTGPN